MNRQQEKLVKNLKIIRKASETKWGILIAKLLKFYNRVIYSCDIGVGSKIPESTIFHHCALGCTIGDFTVLGENCQLYTNVTIGTKEIHNDVKGTNPRIGNNVIIGTGAIILGDITIGDNSVVAAGAVVLKSMPANCLIAGNPAEVKKIYE